jgi:hypothetical protein
MLHSMLDMNYLSDCFCVSKTFLKKSKFFLFFSLLQINIFLVFSDYFDVLHENNFKKIIIKIILIHFRVKNTLKNNHTPKQTLNIMINRELNRNCVKKINTEYTMVGSRSYMCKQKGKNLILT